MTQKDKASEKTFKTSLHYPMSDWLEVHMYVQKKWCVCCANESSVLKKCQKASWALLVQLQNQKLLKGSAGLLL